MGVWTFLWRERRPFREGEGGREGGGESEKEMEMGWRDGPIEKNDVMCSSAAAAAGCMGNGNHRNCPHREGGTSWRSAVGFVAKELLLYRLGIRNVVH